MAYWLDRQNNLIGQESTEALKKARFAVIGLGGVGGAVAEAFARCGIGALLLMDSDTFDESNLNRQILCTRDRIGSSKALTARDRVLSINPDCEVEALEMRLDADTISVLEQFHPDCVVDAVDQVTAKLQLIGWCKQHRVHVVSSMGTGNRTDASSFTIGDIADTAGCGCPLARVMRRELRARGIEGVDVLYGREAPVHTGMRLPASISFVPPVAGYLIAGHAVREYLQRSQGSDL